MKRIKWLLVVFLVIGVLGAYYGKPSENEKKPPVRIALRTWPGWCHVFLAEKKGFFKKYAVDVELVHFKEYSDAAKAFLNGDVDGIFQTFADTIMQSEEIASKVVYVTDISLTGDVIVGRPDHLSDLKGKTIGIEGINTFSHIFVIRALENAGLHEYDFKVKNIDAQDVLEALADGRIDAGHTWEPTKSAAIKKGYKVLASAADVEGVITDLLVFRTPVTEERSADIQSIVRALVVAQEYCDAHWAESIKLMADAVAMSYSEMESGLLAIRRLNLKDNMNAMRKSDSNQSLHGSLIFISNFYFNRGQLSKMPDFDQIIEPKFLNQLSEKRKREEIRKQP
jgi:NitT/TauT family transport system substrate-binding protein